MKIPTILIAAGLAGALFTATPTQAQSEGDIAGCATLGEYAEWVMEQRQQGTSLTIMLTTASSAGEGAASGIVELAHDIILLAYDEPRWHTERMRKEAARDFRNNLEITCLRME